MNLDEMARMFVDKRYAASALCAIYEKKGRKIRCPKCGSDRRYFTGEGYLCCAQCRGLYRPFQKTWFGKVGINLSRWIMLVHLFNVESSALAASKKTGISYPTVHKAFDCMRRAILEYLSAKEDGELLSGNVEADEAYFGGRRKKRGRGSKDNKQIVFGVKERENGRVRVCMVKDAGAATLTENIVRMVEKGSVIYTDQWVGYNMLVLSGFEHKVINHREFHRFGDVHTNGIEGFWSYARERLARYHGVNPENFAYYIKEIEWRYNNRDGDLDLVLLECLMFQAG